MDTKQQFYNDIKHEVSVWSHSVCTTGLNPDVLDLNFTRGRIHRCIGGVVSVAGGH